MTRNYAGIAGTAAVVAVMALTLTAFGADGANAQAQRLCMLKATAIADQLGAQYGEALTAAGVDNNGNLVQVYSSESGSWSIVVTIPGGMTCIVSAGEGWVRERTAELPKPGHPS